MRFTLINSEAVHVSVPEFYFGPDSCEIRIEASKILHDHIVKDYCKDTNCAICVNLSKLRECFGTNGLFAYAGLQNVTLEHLLTSDSDNGARLKLIIKGKALQLLQLVFGNLITLQIELRNVKFHTDSLSTVLTHQTLLKTTQFKLGHGTSKNVSGEGSVDFPDEWKYILEQSNSASPLTGEFFADITVNLFINKEKEKLNEISHVAKQILDEQLDPNISLICKTGEEILCHSGFLVAQSEVLKTMLYSDLKERKSRKIVMDDMTKKGVNGFLSYLYYRGVDAPEENCEIAVDLLKSGHKYAISSMENSMKLILLNKQADWFTVDSTLTLFFFATKVESLQELKLKAVQVLKAKHHALKSSTMLGQIFKDNPSAARELFEASIEP